uniref:PABS domain-containing protein n=1 Tax=viral metagenome TaxID=1070528 RepID=A0A6C0KPJ8_9ZZZZ
MSTSSYEETLPNEVGCIEWKGVDRLHSVTTKRGTHVEMVYRPEYGISCFMDGSIQSCERDERIYHEALVHPVMMASPNRKRVMIIGGGEGATAREVLKWSDVQEVHMFEWDKEVVDLFKEKYPEWSKGAWNDPRLTLFYEDIFERIQEIPSTLYDLIIIDLFDPSDENMACWHTLMMHVHNWIHTEGSIVLYAGMRNRIGKEQMYETLLRSMKATKEVSAHILPVHGHITPYRVFIPSFLGESVFLLFQSTYHNREPPFDTMNVSSHITNQIWNSYKTFNW